MTIYLSSYFKYILLALKGSLEVLIWKISGSLLLDLLSNDKFIWLIVILLSYSYHFGLAENSCHLFNILKLQLETYRLATVEYLNANIQNIWNI